jgi:hypothetical protein
MKLLKGRVSWSTELGGFLKMWRKKHVISLANLLAEISKGVLGFVFREV